MGHTRLGRIPTLRKWQDVIALCGAGPADALIPEIADRTLEAAEPALLRAMDDAGLRFAFHALARLALASREADWDAALARIGVNLPADASIFDLAAELQGAVDDQILAEGRATDVSEIAQRAMGEALLELAGPSAASLFGSSADALRSAVRELSTKGGFGALGQRFFGHFLARFLNSYVSRVTASLTGTRSIREVAELSRFNAELTLHCVQSARIVRDFAGEWYSKTEYLHGIDPQNTGGFVAVALKKLAAELRRQGAEE
jgi:hypothetical protein